MARLRKNETSVNTAPAASAAAARRTSATPRKRTAASSAIDKPVEEVGETPTAVTSISETALIEYEPSHEEISAQAYSYWVERGYAEGRPEQDWLRAEAELRSRARAAE
jgi:hypothetical protein